MSSSSLVLFLQHFLKESHMLKIHSIFEHIQIRRFLYLPWYPISMTVTSKKVFLKNLLNLVILFKLFSVYFILNKDGRLIVFILFMMTIYFITSKLFFFIYKTFFTSVIYLTLLLLSVPFYR